MCLDDQILNTYLDGELKEPWKTQVEEHLQYCQTCRKQLENLKELKSILKDAELPESEIKKSQDRVLSMIEKNYLQKKPKKQSFLEKQFKISVPQLAGVAAAFIMVFAGSWAAFGGKNTSNTIPVPDTHTEIEISNITPVKSVQKTDLNSFALEDILKNLDERGYEVELRIKSITPVVFEEEPAELVEETN